MGQKIVISCDTTVALDKDYVKSLNIEMIPLNAIADGVEYHDTVDINAEKLSELMRNGATISTSTPTIMEIEDYFDEIFKRTHADVIIHFPISSKLSSMHSLFTTVCKERYGNRVIVFDTLSICGWMANQVLYAQRLVEKGYQADEIVKIIKEELVDTEDCVFVPDSLEYLKRGGRITAATAALANFIGVVPILTFNNGEVGKKGVTRTMRKAFVNGIKEWEDNIPNLHQDYRVLVLSSDSKCDAKVEAAVEIVKEYLPDMDVSTGRLSLNVTAHTGPGTMGISILKKTKLA